MLDELDELDELDDFDGLVHPEHTGPGTEAQPRTRWGERGRGGGHDHEQYCPGVVVGLDH